MYRAKVIEDSVNPYGDRLTTMECTFPRFILAEFNTHRVFSRNSASSRAIPTPKIIEQVRTNPATPIRYQQNIPGMQGGADLSSTTAMSAREQWIYLSRCSANVANEMHNLGVHKQVVNRILEPFMWHTVVVSSTEWDNFFEQRIDDGAQPEMHLLASMMKSALDTSAPTRVNPDGWHLPYVTSAERRDFDINTQLIMSSSRCAAVSYLRQGERKPLEKEIELHNRLSQSWPQHLSPFEHQATVGSGTLRSGNFRGWIQYRVFVQKPKEAIVDGP